MMLLARLLVLSSLAACGLAQTNPAVLWTEQDPFLPRSGEKFKYRVRLSATVTAVALRPLSGAADLPFTALGGNRWEIDLTAPQFTARDIYNKAIGRVVITSAGVSRVESNILIHGRNDDMPAVKIVKLADDVQRGDYVVNISSPTFFASLLDAQGAFSPKAEIPLKRLYQLLGDDYDFANLIVTTTSFISNRYHSTVKNTTLGIGTPQLDTSAFYGSKGKLTGITYFPNVNYVDGADGGFSHELGHQWVQSLKGGALSYGQPHWPLSTMATGIMGWSNPVNSEGLLFACTFTPTNGGYTVTTRSTPAVFNDFDLYLMGLLPASEVQPQVVITDAQKIQAGQTGSCGGIGVLSPGQFQMVTAQDLIQLAGPRVPAAADAPKSYRMLTVVVSRDGLLTADELSYFEFMARRTNDKGLVPQNIGLAYGYTIPFAPATRNKGDLNLRLTSTALPEINYAGVVNAASFDKASLTPGTVASIFGANLATTTAGASAVPLPQMLGGVRVIVDGKPAPLFYVSPGQINFQIPDRLPTTPLLAIDSGYTTQVRVERDGYTSNAAYIGLFLNAPGIITYGNNLAVATDANNKVIGPDNPAKPGSIVILYFVGASNLSEVPIAGMAAPADKLVRVNGASSVNLNDYNVLPDFIGLSPGGVGLLQANVRIPSQAAAGNYKLTLIVNGARSNDVTLAVAP